MKYIFNIGLNNTNYSKVVEQINNAKGYYFKDYHIKEEVSSYNNEVEPTAVLKFNSEAHFSSVVILVKQWCKTLQQDCIAVKMYDNDNKQFNALVYADDYNGITQSFNDKYFID